MNSSRLIRLLLAVISLLLLPIDKFRRHRSLTLPATRVDERDTLFARLNRKPGTFPYDDYYARRPELKRVDDNLRRMTPLCKPGSKYYHRSLMMDIDRLFDSIPNIEVDVDLVCALANRIQQSKNQPQELNQVLTGLGAVNTGFTALPESFVYTHNGRTDDNYGKPVTDSLPRAIVFLVEMDHDRMRKAPQSPVFYESALQYYRAARIAKTVSAVLHELGYHATTEYDAHYTTILPPLAVMAGLGELGRNNLLITDRFGSRVRIGAVLTDIPLPQASPIDLGVQHFCAICKKCATNCPSKSISQADLPLLREPRKWTTQVERCMAYWRTMGTDCGICMAVCPYSHKSDWFHNSVRFLIRLNPWMRHLANYADDLIYGKIWKPLRTKRAKRSR